MSDQGRPECHLLGDLVRRCHSGSNVGVTNGGNTQMLFSCAFAAGATIAGECSSITAPSNAASRSSSCSRCFIHVNTAICWIWSDFLHSQFVYFPVVRQTVATKQCNSSAIVIMCTFVVCLSVMFVCCDKKAEMGSHGFL